LTASSDPKACPSLTKKSSQPKHQIIYVLCTNFILINLLTIKFTAPEPNQIIRVPKSPSRAKRPSSYVDQTLPDINEDFELLHHKHVGNSIRKSTKPPLTDADCNPKFIAIQFNQDRDQAYLEKHLKIGPSVPPEIKIRIIALVKKIWCCFYEENVKIPITGYECVIDTGSAIPTITKNIRYGIHKTPVMRLAIDTLLANDQICVDVDSAWLSKAVLAPKPHQEHVTNIS
jgi:hypothetical protein